MDLNQASALEIANAIKRREITVIEVLEHFISEQKKWNPLLNAMVENLWEEARAEAQLKDRELAEDPDKKLPPLFGVPFTIKEMIAVRGLHSTVGSIHHKNDIKERDASLVQRLREAGALILGTTNVPELGFWFECENPVYGRTNNPYDLNRTCGGSSGGEAALIGAGASLVGLGSDVGGSIRMPAAFCGVFGHKPSNRIVPITGHYPVDFAVAKDFNGTKYPLTTIGPLARKATDLRPILELCLGPDGFDWGVKKDFKLGPPVTDWSNSKVWILPDPQMSMVGRTEEAVSEAVLMAGKYFEGMGAELKVLRRDFFKEALLLWSTGLAEVDGRSFEAALFEGQETSIPMEMIKSFGSAPNYSFPALATAVAERLARKAEGSLHEEIQKRKLRLSKLRDELNLLLKGNNILILPAHPRRAPKHRGTYLRPFDFAMTAIFNVLGQPVTAAPISMNEGLPTGVQIVSSWGQDHVSISAAETLEQAFGGWQAPELPKTQI